MLQIFIQRQNIFITSKNCRPHTPAQLFPKIAKNPLASSSNPNPISKIQSLNILLSQRFPIPIIPNSILILSLNKSIDIIHFYQYMSQLQANHSYMRTSAIIGGGVGNDMEGNILKNKYDFSNRVVGNTLACKGKVIGESEQIGIVKKYENQIAVLGQEYAKAREEWERNRKEMLSEMIPMMSLLLSNSSFLQEFKKTLGKRAFDGNRDLMKQYTFLREMVFNENKRIGFRIIARKQEIINPEVIRLKNSKMTIKRVVEVTIPNHTAIHFTDHLPMKFNSREKDQKIKHRLIPHSTVPEHVGITNAETVDKFQHRYKQRIQSLQHLLQEERVNREKQLVMIDDLNQQIMQRQLQCLNMKCQAKEKYGSFRFNS